MLLEYTIFFGLYLEHFTSCFSNVLLVIIQNISDSMIKIFRPSLFIKGKTTMLRSVRIIGWSTALFSIIIILSEVFNLLTNPMEQLNMVLRMFPQAKSGTDAVAEMFQYSRIWSIYTILYFLYVFVGSIQFIRFKAIGRMILEIACRVGIMNACIDTFISYMLWMQMQRMLSTATGFMGTGLGNLNPLGMATIILGFFLWIIPTVGMIVYLRKPGLKALMK